MDVDAATPNKTGLEGWTKHEKYLLYVGVKSRGSRKVEEIEKTIPTKTHDEIRSAIAYYRNCANTNPECTKKKLKVRKAKRKPLIPLASWAKLLTEKLDYKDLQTETIAALRMIADLESFPESMCTEQIDFRKIYHQIADAMEGKAIPDDHLIMEVLNSCVLDTALVSKPFIRPSSFRYIISNVTLSEKDTASFSWATKDTELAIARHLAAQRNYNPLSIPEDALTATKPQITSSK